LIIFNFLGQIKVKIQNKFLNFSMFLCTLTLLLVETTQVSFAASCYKYKNTIIRAGNSIQQWMGTYWQTTAISCVTSYDPSCNVYYDLLAQSSKTQCPNEKIAQINNAKKQVQQKCGNFPGNYLATSIDTKPGVAILSTIFLWKDSFYRFEGGEVYEVRLSDIIELIKFQSCGTNIELNKIKQHLGEDIESTDTFTCSGSATNVTANITSGFRLEIFVNKNLEYHFKGKFDGRNLFGHFDASGIQLPLVSQEADFKCLQSTGKLSLGDDDSGFPNGTETAFTMSLIFNLTSVRGVYHVGVLPNIDFEQYGIIDLSCKK